MSTYNGLTDDECHDNAEAQKWKLFDSLVKSKLGSPLSFRDLQDLDPGITTPHYELYEDDCETHQHVPDIDDDVNQEPGDTYIGAEVSLPHGDSQQTGKVICQVRDQDSELTGTAHNNLILDTCSYQVEFPDSQLGEYSTNVITQNMLSQCDLDGNQFLLMESIVDHKITDEALLKPSQMHDMIKGKRHQRKTTKGWLICVEWRDGSTSWEKLSSLKELYPVELAEYSVAQGINHQPAFCWWVPHVLHKQDCIIAAINKCYHNQTHKFGFKVLKTVKCTLEINHENRNPLWQDAIALEMEAVRVAFKVMIKVKNHHPDTSIWSVTLCLTLNWMVFDAKLVL